MVAVVLLERIEKLGQMGQVVNVKPGFARNYLLPQKKAMRATKDNLAYFETQRAQLEAANLNRKSEAEVVEARPLKDLDAKWAANDEAAINFLKMVYNSFKRS